VETLRGGLIEGDAGDMLFEDIVNDRVSGVRLVNGD